MSYFPVGRFFRRPRLSFPAAKSLDVATHPNRILIPSQADRILENFCFQLGGTRMEPEKAVK
jgi:hypothetical protein